MVFRRRVPLSLAQKLRGLILPRGGWGRAVTYLRLRLARIPDAPHRIARGLAVGLFVSFSPLLGLHFVLAIAIAYVLRGNIVAALMGTMLSNPLTLPFTAVLSLDLGRAILGSGQSLPFSQIMTAFGQAGDEIAQNVWAVFGPETLHWDKLVQFGQQIFWPYTVGSVVPGLVVALIGYWLCVPALEAYHKLRAARREAKARARAADGAAGKDGSR